MSFFNPLVFSNCFFVFFGFLCFARSTKKLIAKNHFFLCSFPCFNSHVPCPFFSPHGFCQGDLMTEDKTRQQEKWVKAVVGMVTNVWKGGLLLACFSAWLQVWVGGPESTTESALADDFWLGWAAIVCFLWLSDLCVTQRARGTPASELLSSSPYVFSLSQNFYSHYVYPPSSTLGKQILERLGNLRRWGWTWTIRWSVSKIKGRRSC